MIPTSAIFAHLRGVLQRTYFAQDLTLKQLDQLVAALKAARFFKGYEIIRQGAAGEDFYLIATGRVSVWVDKGKGRVKKAELGRDDFFGEMALISNAPRNATVIAEGQVELFVLQKSDFEKILLKNPAIAGKLKKAYDARAAQNL